MLKQANKSKFGANSSPRPHPGIPYSPILEVNITILTGLERGGGPVFCDRVDSGAELKVRARLAVPIPSKTVEARRHWLAVRVKVPGRLAHAFTGLYLVQPSRGASR